MSSLREQRLERLREKLRERGWNAALLTSPVSLGYLTGYSSDPMERFLALWVPAEGETILFVPELDKAKAAAAENIGRFVPLADSESPYGALSKEIGEQPARCGVEKKTLTLHAGEQLALLWPGTRWEEINSALSRIVGCKTREEAETVRQAAHIANEAVERALADFRIGMTEREIAERIVRQIRLLGGDGPAFYPTVLAGERAGLPHGETGDTAVREGDFLLIDMGVSLGGYLSDMTRTLLVGQGTAEQVRMYEAVAEANRRAIEAIRPGVALGAIDAAARSWIEAQGCGEYFIHRVGHGLGMAIHEEPSIHGGNADIIVPGMLFTIEPGVYVPGGGGVRIEDDVYVNEYGETERLTDFPRELRRL
jgi:Xaa-Pro dipeptidase